MSKSKLRAAYLVAAHAACAGVEPPPATTVRVQHDALASSGLAHKTDAAARVRAPVHHARAPDDAAQPHGRDQAGCTAGYYPQLPVGDYIKRSAAAIPLCQRWQGATLLCCTLRILRFEIQTVHKMPALQVKTCCNTRLLPADMFQKLCNNCSLYYRLKIDNISKLVGCTALTTTPTCFVSDNRFNNNFIL